MRSDDRGRTFKSIAGDLPDRQDVWSVVQDHVNGNLLFAGTEFGLFCSVDAGAHWVQLKGGLPTIQVRDLAVQRRENDLVLGTFGRSLHVLDDYRPLREMTTETLAQPAALYPLRSAYQFTELGYPQAAWGNETTPNPPNGAVLTYSVGQPLAANTKIVFTIADDTGKQVRRLEGIPGAAGAVEPYPATAGVHRVVWNLRGDPAAAPAGGRGGAAPGAAGAGGGGGGGRGGAPQGPLVPMGRFTVTMGTMTGDAVTAVGKPQTFNVVPLPAKNY